MEPRFRNFGSNETMQNVLALIFFRVFLEIFEIFFEFREYRLFFRPIPMKIGMGTFYFFYGFFPLCHLFVWLFFLSFISLFLFLYCLSPPFSVSRSLPLSFSLSSQFYSLVSRRCFSFHQIEKKTLVIRRVGTRNAKTILKKDLELAARENNCVRRSAAVRALFSGNKWSISEGEKPVIVTQFFSFKKALDWYNMFIWG